MIDLDDRELLAKYDQSDQLGSMSKWGELVKEAREQSKKLQIPSKVSWKNVSWDYRQPKNVIICGMGGSAIAGDYFVSLFEDKLSIPVIVNKEYTLPKFVDSESLVICISYSGNTEETLSRYHEALKRKSMIVSIASAGLLEKFATKIGTPHVKIRAGIPPRTAFPLMYTALITIFEILGLIGSVEQQLDEVISIFEKLAIEYSQESPIKENIAKEISYGIFNSTPLFIGYSIYSPIAYRAKTQLNENSKLIAIAETLPEQNHNGIVIFDNPNTSLDNIAFIFIHDKKEPRQIATRFEEVKKLASERSEKVLEILPQGKSKLAKQLSTTYLVDFISIYLGILYEIDPSATPSIDKLKETLKKKINLQVNIEEDIL
ncbi:MAG: bifunctional phosphoglucose/phosphomannose isomerase [Candidatus Heimdallarchaeota archaeon]|nr:bifunctional phosphoglucose/phosphomannose isomerase [Candidatus Heimdallarchaeota archaeon]